jgi:hypothetical protein
MRRSITLKLYLSLVVWYISHEDGTIWAKNADRKLELVGNTSTNAVDHRSTNVVDHSLEINIYCRWLYKLRNHRQ